MQVALLEVRGQAGDEQEQLRLRRRGRECHLALGGPIVHLGRGGEDQRRELGQKPSTRRQDRLRQRQLQLARRQLTRGPVAAHQGQGRGAGRRRRLSWRHQLPHRPRGRSERASCCGTGDGRQGAAQIRDSRPQAGPRRAERRHHGSEAPTEAAFQPGRHDQVAAAAGWTCVAASLDPRGRCQPRRRRELRGAVHCAFPPEALAARRHEAEDVGAAEGGVLAIGVLAPTAFSFASTKVDRALAIASAAALTAAVAAALLAAEALGGWWREVGHRVALPEVAAALAQSTATGRSDRLRHGPPSEDAAAAAAGLKLPGRDPRPAHWEDAV
mmetsp:Transcript_27935/g.92789  ORF Transcript_27935/g.92789 Transcript_27935/m.92789 type:complete len:328 (-) Transcript_27935:868-1851(-)